MEKLRFAVAGMGNRGTQYASKQFEFPDDMEVVAMADNRPERTKAANKYLHLPADRIFSSVEEMLKAPKLADVMIIATQDAQHKDHAIAAMEKGYDLILEKPIANHIEDVQMIAKKAEALGRRVLVCHVLRYTPFYRAVKEQLKSGVIGRIETASLEEAIGYYHIAHSYVRGNWHKLEDSSPLIVAKCCHDMDLILWLTGEHALKVSSFGSLDYFKPENCPEGATERCTDGCPHAETCVFNAPKFYLKRIPGWPSNILVPEPTEESILEALRTTNYGRCVYKMDNNVCDHQVLSILLTNGVTANFTVSGFNAVQTRRLRITGTEGELWGDFREGVFHIQRFREKPMDFDVNDKLPAFKGHGGGDSGLIRDAISYFRNEDFDRTSITELLPSVESHSLAFAAEESRVHGGETVDLRTAE